jgi:hypothetical protein
MWMDGHGNYTIPLQNDMWIVNPLYAFVSHVNLFLFDESFLRKAIKFDLKLM